MKTELKSIGMCGKIGKAISLFWLFRDTNEEEWKLKADTLLEEVFNECNRYTSFSYSSGYCGVGAGVEYLLQNKFEEGNADEILTEIDSFIIRVINARPMTDLTIENGVLGIAYYLYYRLCYRVNEEGSITLTLKEHVIHLIDWIADLLMDPSVNRSYHEVYFTLVILHQLNIFNVKIENMMEWCDKELLTLEYAKYDTN